MQGSTRRDVLRLTGVGMLGAAAAPAGYAKAPRGGLLPAGAVFSVRDFGATGDGKTLDTEAVNRAIQAADSKGGGIVFFPPGQYLCFSIRLRSYVDLLLSSGSILIAADGPKRVTDSAITAEPTVPRAEDGVERLPGLWP